MLEVHQMSTCCPVFPSCPVVRQDHVTLGPKQRRKHVSPHVLSLPAVVIIGLHVEIIGPPGGISLDPWGTVCKEVSVLERHWPTRGCVWAKKEHYGLTPRYNLFYTKYSRSLLCMTKRVWELLWKLRPSSVLYLLSSSSGGVYSFFPGVVEKLLIHKGQKLKNYFYQRLRKSLK